MEEIERQFRFSFKLKKKLHIVSLDKDQIKWKKEDKNDLVRTIPIRDVIAVKFLDKTPDGDWGFVIHFVCKPPPPSYTWKLCEETFKTQDQSVCEEWVKHINNYSQQEDFEKPTSLLVFVNPKSGSGSGVSIYKKKIAPIFDLANIKTEIIQTQHASHAATVLNEYDISTIDGVVSVGGDGSFQQVFNALVHRTARDNGADVNNMEETLHQPKLRLGLIPCGTGQGCTINATGSRDHVTAALHIISGHSREWNLISVHNDGKLLTYGAMLGCYGVFGDVIHKSESHRELGRARYLYGIATVFTSFRIFDAEIEYLQTPKNSTEEGAESGGWKKAVGTFCGVHFGVFDIYIKNKNKDKGEEDLFKDESFALDLIRDRAGRMGLMKQVFAAARQQTPTETDTIQTLRVTRSRLRLKRLNMLRADGIPNDVINIDGEALLFTDPVVDIRVHSKLLRVFGTGIKCDDGYPSSANEREMDVSQ